MAEEIPEGALGRVRSFDQLISFASRPFGLAVAAPLAGVTGVTVLALTGGVLVVAANLAALVLLRARSRDSSGDGVTPARPSRVPIRRYGHASPVIRCRWRQRADVSASRRSAAPRWAAVASVLPGV